MCSPPPTHNHDRSCDQQSMMEVKVYNVLDQVIKEKTSAFIWSEPLAPFLSPFPSHHPLGELAAVSRANLWREPSGQKWKPPDSHHISEGGSRISAPVKSSDETATLDNSLTATSSEISWGAKPLLGSGPTETAGGNNGYCFKLLSLEGWAICYIAIDVQMWSAINLE